VYNDAVDIIVYKNIENQIFWEFASLLALRISKRSRGQKRVRLQSGIDFQSMRLTGFQPLSKAVNAVWERANSIALCLSRRSRGQKKERLQSGIDFQSMCLTGFQPLSKAVNALWERASSIALCLSRRSRCPKKERLTSGIDFQSMRPTGFQPLSKAVNAFGSARACSRFAFSGGAGAPTSNSDVDTMWSRNDHEKPTNDYAMTT
jgi:hypothetical protein